jgi:hypothetical protein
VGDSGSFFVFERVFVVIVSDRSGRRSVEVELRSGKRVLVIPLTMER